MPNAQFQHDDESKVRKFSAHDDLLTSRYNISSPRLKPIFNLNFSLKLKLNPECPNHLIHITLQEKEKWFGHRVHSMLRNNRTWELVPLEYLMIQAHSPTVHQVNLHSTRRWTERLILGITTA